MADKNMPNTGDERSRTLLPSDGEVSGISCSQGVQSSRRRFALAAGSTSVLFALVNRPALGAWACVADTPSGFDSLKASGRKGDRENLLCGKSPGYWGNAAKVQGASSSELGRLFTDVFVSANHFQVVEDVRDADLRISALTLGDVVSRHQHKKQSFRDPDNLARAFVAAYMNATTWPGTYPLSPRHVVSMWQELDGAGVYMVRPGVSWDKARVKEYLESTYERTVWIDDADEFFDVSDSSPD